MRIRHSLRCRDFLAEVLIVPRLMPMTKALWQANLRSYESVEQEKISRAILLFPTELGRVFISTWQLIRLKL